jgi:NAD+ synthase
MEYIKSDKKEELSTRQKEVIEIYKRFNTANQHKMIPIPVCTFPESN